MKEANEFIYVIDNNLEKESETFLSYAKSLGIVPTVFSKMDDFLDHYSIKSEEVQRTSSKYLDFQTWLSHAHVIINLYKGRKRSGWSPPEPIFPSVILGFRITDFGFNSDRVAETLHRALGPELNKQSMLQFHGHFSQKTFSYWLQHSVDKQIDGVPAILKPDKPGRRLVGQERLVWEEAQESGSQIKTFFDHCPYCLGTDIRITPYTTSKRRWEKLAGQAGWVTECCSCNELLYYKVVVTKGWPVLYDKTLL